MFTRNSCALLFDVFVMSVCASGLAHADTAPCDLLTQAQLSSVTGVSLGAGAPIATTGCSWKATGKTNLVVTVSLQNEKMFTGAKGASAPKMTKTAVSGIGDEAIFVGVEGFSSLWVRKGSKYLLVRIYGLPVDEAQTRLKALAASAVSKL